MSYLSPFFVVFLIAVLMVYYLIPAHARYIWLLAASICFYYCLNKEAILYMICFIIYTFVVGIILDRLQNANFRKFTFSLNALTLSRIILLCTMEIVAFYHLFESQHGSISNALKSNFHSKTL